MIEHTTLDVSGDRFAVEYSIYDTLQNARDLAEKVCVEQTIEFPPELIQDDDIRAHIFGRIEKIETSNDECHHVTISYANEISSYSFPQLINVIYGNISLFPTIRVEKLDLSPGVASVFKGPRFGTDGLRGLFQNQHGPMFMSALKPQGLSAGALANQAYELALGELDIIKDDHGLANQQFSPFRERVERCCEAIRRANDKTGGHSIYAPMLSSPSEDIFADALYAKNHGAGALLVAPALVGFDLARRLAESDEIALPIIGHPAMMGSYLMSPKNGFSHYAMLGQVMRIIGMDATIFPNYGGRFSFSQENCERIVAGCSEEMNHFKPILPSPGGGMTFEIIPAIARFYGNNVLYLMGGDLHKRELPLAECCKKLRELATTG